MGWDSPDQSIYDQPPLIEELKDWSEAKTKEAKQREDGRDEWSTPEDVKQFCCDYWEIYPEIDLFASAENTKCKHFITKEMNALDCDWMSLAKAWGVKPIGWLQPPYSQPIMTEALKKAIKEAEKGFTSVFLLPLWMDQAWYHDLILDPLRPHRPYKGRIKFIPPPGIKPSSPRYGNFHGVVEGKRIVTPGRVWTEADRRKLNDEIFLAAQKTEPRFMHISEMGFYPDLSEEVRATFGAAEPAVLYPANLTWEDVI